MKRLDRVEKNINSIPYRDIGFLVKNSVQHNFDVGGRPESWPPRKDDKPHKLLIKTGKLKNSIYVEQQRDSVSVGTRVPYQATHNFGDPGRNIPQREYLLVQEQDKNRIIDIIKNHVLKK